MDNKSNFLCDPKFHESEPHGDIRWTKEAAENCHNGIYHKLIWQKLMIDNLCSDNQRTREENKILNEKLFDLEVRLRRLDNENKSR